MIRNLIKPAKKMVIGVMMVGFIVGVCTMIGCRPESSEWMEEGTEQQEQTWPSE